MAQKLVPNDERFTVTHPSNHTIAERNRFASLLDDFTTFKWNNTDMFANFGAFIINEKKGSLKLFNGASFTNNYTKQQFQDGYTNLSGVTFNTQQISFTIGVYWISIEDYRALMNLLHPYEVSMLSFSFEPKYGYKCKLTTIKDSTRYVIGQETAPLDVDKTAPYTRLEGGGSGGYRYYTELNLTFDVIGRQCARQIEPSIYNFINHPKTQDKCHHTDLVNNSDGNWAWQEVWPSDLDFPVTINCNNYWAHKVEGDRLPVQLRATAEIQNPQGHTIGSPVVLFDITLQNLQYGNNASTQGNATRFSFTYDSEQGLIYWKIGNKEQILSLLSINTEGQRFVGALNVNRFYWPGRLNSPEVDDYANYQFVITIYDMNNNVIMINEQQTSTKCEMSARTNVI